MRHAFIALLLLSGCAIQAEPAQDSICLSHTPSELAEGLACAAGAPDCGFNSSHEPVPIEPTSAVSEVCHCISGRYACFGRQP